ncbi:uncharacterized protein LOC115966874 [Quercus lobata]|uniref:uncharacterized protein LOC115966874 n=1 Tax=Quercus lobata TaxID=97700 RepID=UPI001246313B|nr:uncharacterized protein LOC115966874 [Quercus lobata]
MVIHSKNEALTCKVFLSSLRPVAMRWFDGLGLTQTFSSRFITCSRVSRPLNSLFSLFMREGETLKTNSDRYWKIFNEIDDDFDDVAISTFKVGLSAKHGLRKSLTGNPVISVCQLMERIDKYKRVEEDQQGKRKAKVIPQERRDFSYDAIYRRRSKTPPSESFSYDEEHHHKRRYKSPPRKGLGNDTMSKALNQISKSPFTCKIEGAKPPQQFN